MLKLVALATLFVRFCVGGIFSVPFTGSSQQPLNDGEVKIMRPPTGGTYFDNPSYDCKHASQPHIFDVFSKLELQPERLSQTMDPNAKFHIIGNHPLAGKYSSLEMYAVPTYKAVNPHIGYKYWQGKLC